MSERIDDRETPDAEAKKENNNSIAHAQPLPGGRDDVSYVDSDTHAAMFCCLPHCCDNGEDSRWYYPWDKGLARLTGLGLIWCCVCLWFPCCVCVPECRQVACMVDQGCWRGTCCESLCKQPDGQSDIAKE